MQLESNPGVPPEYTPPDGPENPSPDRGDPTRSSDGVENSPVKPPRSSAPDRGDPPQVKLTFQKIEQLMEALGNTPYEISHIK